MIDKIGTFVTKAEESLKDTGTTVAAVYKHTLDAIQHEINHVINDVKPVSGLINEVKNIVGTLSLFSQCKYCHVIKDSKKNHIRAAVTLCQLAI